MMVLLAGAWRLGLPLALWLLIFIGFTATATFLLRIILIYVYYRCHDSHAEAVDQINRRLFQT